MPRQPRKLSPTGYYHLIVRGIGKQALFEAPEDYAFYLKKLFRFSQEAEVAVCAYCLMENHVHLLVRDEKGRLPAMMKRLGVSYAIYFNQKYARTGHLFQDRYLSEPVSDEPYLLTVFRYILNNPAKAGICPATEYAWSSYALYDRPDALVDTSIFHALLGGSDHYAAFIQTPNEDRCLECDFPPRNDEWARAVIQRRFGAQSGTILQGLDRRQRNAALRELKRSGLSVRQIERLTGISRNIVQRA